MRKIMLGGIAVLFLTGFQWWDPAVTLLKRMRPQQYISWVESEVSGLVAQSSSETLNYVLRYQPLDYLALKAVDRRGGLLSKKTFLDTKQELGDLEYYQFYVALKEGSDFIKTRTKNHEEYDHLLRYMSSSMQEDLSLVADADTLSCQLFHFERTYGVTPYASFTLGFESQKAFSSKGEDTGRTFLLESEHLGDTKLHIPGTHLNNIPRLVIKD